MPPTPFSPWAIVVRVSALVVPGLLVLPLLRAQDPGPGIVLNEIHYHPDVDTEAVEFIELLNAGAETVDLSGWMFSDGIAHVFPE
ncbi:MAG TPA: lamin tail domain-containing protein, partial [Verrucomicrobiales bacterium]|nr:lamin tail domain-containing protein [Verrucomicrobiales bacterium]